MLPLFLYAPSMSSEQPLGNSLPSSSATPSFSPFSPVEPFSQFNGTQEEEAKSEIARKRGGQPRNQNARKHGFYAKSLSPAEQALLESAGDTKSLTNEIALVRVKLFTLLTTPETPPDVLIKALRILKNLIEVQNRFRLH